MSETNFERIGQVEKLVHQDATDRVIQLGGNCIAVADDDWLFYGPASKVWQELGTKNGVLLAPCDGKACHPLELALNRSIEVAGYTFCVSSEAGRPAAKGRLVIALPSAALENGPVLRTVRTGDQWARSGISVREWLRLHSVHSIVRNRLMVIATERGVWWVPTIAVPIQDQPRGDEPVMYVTYQPVSPGVECEGC